MNDTPATEYAVYYLDSDRYLIDSDGYAHTFPSAAMADHPDFDQNWGA